jgi:hypothetical protein
MNTRIVILFFICALFSFGLCEGHSSTTPGPVPNWQWIESSDVTSVYVDMNKKDFKRIDKNNFSYWMVVTNIHDNSIVFYHIIADTLNKNYKEDRSIRLTTGEVSLDTNELDNWKPDWRSYSITYQGDAINYILNHLADLEGKK